MLHGYLSSKESFIRQIDFFARFRRVIAVDMSGFGKSPPIKFEKRKKNRQNSFYGRSRTYAEKKFSLRGQASVFSYTQKFSSERKTH